MNASRVKAQTHGQNKGSVSSEQQQRASRTNRSNRVLAERNQAVAAVGAWVEDGHDFEQHPSVSLVINLYIFAMCNQYTP